MGSDPPSLVQGVPNGFLTSQFKRDTLVSQKLPEDGLDKTSNLHTVFTCTGTRAQDTLDPSPRRRVSLVYPQSQYNC